MHCGYLPRHTAPCTTNTVGGAALRARMGIATWAKQGQTLAPAQCKRHHGHSFFCSTPPPSIHTVLSTSVTCGLWPVASMGEMRAAMHAHVPPVLRTATMDAGMSHRLFIDCRDDMRTRKSMVACMAAVRQTPNAHHAPAHVCPPTRRLCATRRHHLHVCAVTIVPSHRQAWSAPMCPAEGRHWQPPPCLKTKHRPRSTGAVPAPCM